MKKLFKALVWLFGKEKPKPAEQSKPIEQRLHPRNVKRGDLIIIEYKFIQGGSGEVVCLNNDPVTKKMLIQIHWNNYKEHDFPEFQKIILDYNGYELRNFHLLNQYKENKSGTAKPKDETEMQKLKREYDEAIKQEEYEQAQILLEKINKLKKN